MYKIYKKKLCKNMTSNAYLNQYLANIGYDEKTVQYLKKAPELHSWRLMYDIEPLINFILNWNNPIEIVGDFDADGITSTSILVLTLQKLGKQVDYYIPHRIYDGYGLSVELVNKIYDKYHNKNETLPLLLTCDNGIVASDAVERAAELNMDVVITDHHTLNPELLPKSAKYILHPAMPYGENNINNPYPFREISGATVAFKLCLGLLEVAKIKDIELENYLTQLAAISVVSDVMPLGSNNVEKLKNNENRKLLTDGLNLLNNNPDKHMKIFYDVCNIHQHIDETTIGFYIAPVINAVGRLDTAKIGVKFFTANNEKQANLYGAIMHFLNEERKTLKNESLQLIEKKLDTSTPIILVKDEELHEGIIGILAGNICQKYQKPTIVFTKSEKNGKSIWKGSARSTENVNIYSVLQSVQEMSNSILGFGGHAGAAGLSILNENWENFSNAINEYAIKNNLDSLDSNTYCLEIPVNQINAMAKAMDELKPWGEGISKPIITFKTKVKALDLYYSSNHVKFCLDMGNPYQTNSLWLFNKLDSFLQSPELKLFKKEKDNVDKRSETMSYQEAFDSRWEHWVSNTATYKFITELSYGPNFMNKMEANLSLLDYELEK